LIKIKFPGKPFHQKSTGFSFVLTIKNHLTLTA
jgi:hypothetical protein